MKKRDKAPDGFEWKSLPKTKVVDGKTIELKGTIKILVPIQ